MSETATPSGSLRHGLRRMRGRDPHESHRVATPLELLFDLTFVIAFGSAANELAHALSEDHVVDGLIGFCFAVFAVSWAWINFSWFASAYDTDDWVYRLLTMLQMIGVLVLALGLPAMFESLSHDVLDNRVMVGGYVIMRIAMVGQWLRVAAQDPDHRPTARTYVVTLLVSQLLWCGLIVAPVSVGWFFLLGIVPFLVELGGPYLAETRAGGTPWHPHHIAERYGLLVIIALGEGLIGTMATLSAQVGPDGPGWSVDVGVLALAGTALTFGMWWCYFVLPTAETLHTHRERSFGFGYGHMVVFGAIVAVGAGVHVAAYLVEHHTELGPVATALTIAVPLAIYTVSLFVVYAALTRSLPAFHYTLIAASLACIAAAVGLAGVSFGGALLLLAATPWITVVGYELVGHRHLAAAIGRDR